MEQVREAVETGILRVRALSMAENSMQKVGVKGGVKDSGYKPSAPANYRTPNPVRVPPAPAKQGK
jgi:hypothetical protein